MLSLPIMLAHDGDKLEAYPTFIERYSPRLDRTALPGRRKDIFGVFTLCGKIIR